MVLDYTVFDDVVLDYMEFDNMVFHYMVFHYKVFDCMVFDYRLSGVSTPYTPFCLICTISSELKCVFHVFPFELAGVHIRWFSVNGFNTRCIPSSTI